MEEISILLVEDNPLAQKMASVVLKSLKCQVDVAENGEKALTMAQARDYKVIFMDIGLPDMDGHAVTMKIREFEKSNRHTTIVALTAHANEAEKQKAIQSGMDGFYAKPLTPQIAQEILNQYVK